MIFRNWLLAAVLVIAPLFVNVTAHAETSPTEKAAEQDAPRLTPVTGIYADTTEWIVSPLILTEPALTQQRTDLQRELERRAGRRIFVTGPPPDAPQMGWLNQAYEDALAAHDEYRFTGELLLMANTLLRNRDARWQLVGLTLAQGVQLQLNLRVKDNKLSSEVVRLYLLPSIYNAETSSEYGLTRAEIAYAMVEALRRIDRDDKFSAQEKFDRLPALSDALKLWISVTPDTAGADYARWDIAKLWERRGEFQTAIDVIHEIDPNGPHFNAYREIPRLQAKIDAAKPKEEKPKQETHEN